MLSRTPPPDTVFCLFCGGTITYIDGGKNNFFDHLKHEHSIHYEKEFVFAVNFFEEDIRRKIVENFNEDLRYHNESTSGNDIEALLAEDGPNDVGHDGRE